MYNLDSICSGAYIFYILLDVKLIYKETQREGNIYVLSTPEIGKTERHTEMNLVDVSEGESQSFKINQRRLETNKSLKNIAKHLHCELFLFGVSKVSSNNFWHVVLIQNNQSM